MIFTPRFPFVVTQLETDYEYGFEDERYQHVLDVFKRTAFSSKMRSFKKHHRAYCEKLGKGSYAITFSVSTLPHDAIKIQTRPDPCYQAWMEDFVLTGQKNPFVPQVKGYATNRFGRTLCIMERLYTPNFNEEALASFRWFKEGVLSKKSISYDELQEHVRKILELDNLPTEVVHIVDYIAEAASDGTPHSADLSRVNIMQRANGERVITDPLSLVPNTLGLLLAQQTL